MKKRKEKQIQWGTTILIGLLILVGTVGSLENGGDLAPNIFKGVLGAIIALWGVVKSNQWGFFNYE